MTAKTSIHAGIRSLSRSRLTTDTKKILTDNLLATFATTIAGLLGFFLQALVSHTLEPVKFGAAFALISFYSIIVRPAATVGRLVAWRTSSEVASDKGSKTEGNTVLRVTIKWLLIIGVVLSGLSILAGKTIGGYIHLTTTDIILASLSVPFLLAFQPLLGALQGDRRFKAWSSLNIVLPLSYVLLVVVLVFPFGVAGVIGGVTLGSAISFFIGLYILRRSIWSTDRSKAELQLGKYLPFLTTGLATTLTVGVFISADVIVVQHFFNRTIAGQYAIVAVIGNALFSVAGGVLSATFPSIVARQTRHQSTVPILLGTLSVFILVTITGATAIQALGEPILRIVGGTKYIGAASFIGWYSLGMGMLSWATILIHTQQARNRMHLLWILLPALAARISLLLLFHRSIMMVVTVSDTLVFLLCIVLFITYLLDEAKLQRGARL